MAKGKYLPNQSRGTIEEMRRMTSVLASRVVRLEQQLGRRQVHSQWYSPVWQNGFVSAVAPLDEFAYRVYTGGVPEFKGHINTAGGTSGAVAFTLPLGPSDVTMPRNVYFHTIITDDDGSSFQLARVFIESTTGGVTITWPAG